MTSEDDHRPLQLLGMFAKWPVPGQVKSRLAAATSAAWAARVAQAFLLDLVERYAQLKTRRVLVYSPEESRSQFAAVVQDRFELLPQSSGDLGERLTMFLRDRFAEGMRAIVLIGTDSPTLPVIFVQQAFDRLHDADIVLGPASDGGYYLIGCRRFVPELFAGISWGSERVLWETCQRVQQCGLRLALLPPWYDVDTHMDWWTLRGHLAALRLAGQDVQAPRTEQLTREFLERSEQEQQ
jgi:rSAM/selenodomain-associated transferase 1